MPLSEKDWILLNAYLDGELAPEEQAAFEARLARDPALQTELDSLRQTVEMIGMTQRRPIPRGVTFTLDPNVYGRAKPRPTGIWGWGTALSAAGALVATAMICAGALVAVGGMSIGGRMAAAPAAGEGYYQAAEEPALAEMVAEMEEAEVIEEEEAVEWVEPEGEVVEEAAPLAEAEPADEEDAVQAVEAPVEEEAEVAAEEEAAPPGTTTPAPAPSESAEAGAAEAEPPPGSDEPLDTPPGEGMGVGGAEPDVPADATTRDMLTPTLETMPSPQPEELAELAATMTPERAPTISPAPPGPSGTTFDAFPMSGVLIGVGMIGLGALLLAVIILAWIARRRR
jgi:hypothetical protein